MSSAEQISLHGVPASSLRLLGEDVLVRATPLEEQRASGLVLVKPRAEHFLGSCFYGVVVAMGPGRLVERAPTPETTARLVFDALRASDAPESRAGLDYDALHYRISKDVEDLVRRHAMREHAPMPWRVGDHVVCRQGFGPEIELREGKHHVVGRGNAQHGHGIIASWEPGHAHCWHSVIRHLEREGERFDSVHIECRCGAVNDSLETRLPACVECPSGERLAEAILAAPVYDVRVAAGEPARQFHDLPGVDGRAGELRPVDDGREDV